MKTRVAVAVAVKKAHVDPPKQSKDKLKFLKNLTVPFVLPLFLAAMIALWWWKEGETKGILQVLVPRDPLLASYANYHLVLASLGGLGLSSLGFLLLKRNKAKRDGNASDRIALRHSRTQRD